MRLAEFIKTNCDSILTEWATFAATCAPASDIMNVTALRDHAADMLIAIAEDLDTSQTANEQEQKSMGRSPDASDMTAAHEHGAGRAESGFTMEQMVSEYRALRASVIRLWTSEQGHLGESDIQDLIRFNEAIDQSLAESVVRYAREVDKSREMFVAILGHDLRSPLGAIVTSAAFMLELDELGEPYRTLLARIASSGTRMDRMVGDLLDLTRSRLGGGIQIERASMDLHMAMLEAVSEVQAGPGRARLDVRASGDLRGDWDTDRLGQVFTNLIGNAVDHGTPDTPITIELNGDDDDVVTIGIHNQGPHIPAALTARIFDPMKRRVNSSAHLGLGLYIAERIVAAHDGSLTVRSSADEGTTFTVRLPRAA